MPKRAVLREWWTPHVESLAANRPQPPSIGVTVESTARGILKDLGDDMAAHPDAEKWKDARELPSLDTVKRIVKVFWGKPAEVQQQYRYVRWPESFESGALPWEAGPTVLALLLHFLGSQPPVGRIPDSDRPTVRQARLYWRVTQAAPALPADRRLRLAGQLVRAEVAEGSADNDFSETYRREVEAEMLWPEAGSRQGHLAVPLVTLRHAKEVFGLEDGPLTGTLVGIEIERRRGEHRSSGDGRPGTGEE